MGDTPIISLWRFEFTKVWSLTLHRTVAVFVMEELHVQGMIVGWTSKVIHVCRPKLARIHQQQRQQRQGADWDEARNPIGSCAPARASWHVSFRLGRRYHGLIGTLFFAYTWFWGSTLNIDFFFRRYIPFFRLWGFVIPYPTPCDCVQSLLSAGYMPTLASFLLIDVTLLPETMCVH